MDKNQINTTKASTRLKRVRSYGINVYFIWRIEAKVEEIDPAQAQKILSQMLKNFVLLEPTNNQATTGLVQVQSSQPNTLGLLNICRIKELREI